MRFVHIRQMALVDLKNIFRDPFIMVMAAAPLFIPLVFRFLLPLVESLFVEYQLEFSLTPYYPFIQAFAFLLTPLVMGFLCGFLALDEKDSRMLPCLAVTPLGTGGYLFYRALLPFFISLVLLIPQPWLIGLYSGYLPFTFLAILLAALESSLVFLFIGAVPSNKVEGLAIGKALGVFFVGPIASLFLPLPWKYFMGISPFWYVTELAMLKVFSLYGIIIFLLGFAFNLLLFIILKNVFVKKLL